MRGRGHHIKAVVKGIFSHTAGNEPSYVRNVDDTVGPDLAGNVDKFLVVELAAVGGETGEYNFWLVFLGGGAHLVVIYFARFDIFHLVAHKVEELGEIGNGVAVCQVPAVGKVHAKNGVAGVKKCKVHRDVGVCT